MKPQAMLGHSIGEYVAACLAGVFSLEDALRLVAARGRLMQGLPPGAMLAVPLSGGGGAAAASAAELAAGGGQRARRCAWSPGPHEAVDALRGAAGRAGRAVRSRLHDLARLPLGDDGPDPRRPSPSAVARGAAAGAARCRSSPTSPAPGSPPTQATDPRYWARHLREPVRFADGLRALLHDAERVLLEVGPGQALGQLAKRHPASRPRARCWPPCHHPRTPRTAGMRAAGLETLGRLWQAGVHVDWKGFHGAERRHRVPLPTYPFERQRYWIEPAAVETAPRVTTASQPVTSAPDATHQASQVEPGGEAVSARSYQPRPQLRGAYVMPGTPLQRSLVELWQEMLGVAPIGIQDNFFELGGDSLIAVQLSGRVKKQLGLDLPASSLYEGVTVEALAALLKPAEAEGQERREEAPAADASLQRRKQTLARQRNLRRFDDEADDMGSPLKASAHATRFRGGAPARRVPLRRSGHRRHL